nr:PREDICTED: uncharacterized protein LOC107398026 isoform X4 [Tribolium castaneum]|eukprot:XP_015836158.1 PREDICTED: uncharacterized protein LOC107398026 isoform X4 [Tribolium castaneum]
MTNNPSAQCHGTNQRSYRCNVLPGEGQGQPTCRSHTGHNSQCESVRDCVETFSYSRKCGECRGVAAAGRLRRRLQSLRVSWTLRHSCAWPSNGTPRFSNNL